MNSQRVEFRTSDCPFEFWEVLTGVLQDEDQHDRNPRPITRDRLKAPLCPSADIITSRTSTPDHLRDIAAAGLAIERPRSALHSGDFREKKDNGGSASGSSAAGHQLWRRGLPHSQQLLIRRNERRTHTR
jgi:hypothetical protein